jgi:hypothetical protein
MRKFVSCRSDLILLYHWFRWVGHVVIMGKTDVYRILGSKPFGKFHLADEKEIER